MSFVIEYSFDVEAAPAVVWEVITDLDRYGQWNPFVLECRSTLNPGDPIHMLVQIGKGTRRQEEIMHDWHDGQGFSYCMKPAPLGALSSFRSHRIEPLANGGSRYHSSFELKGWLAPVVRSLLGSKLEAGFAGMSRGIRDRAQSLARERAAA